MVVIRLSRGGSKSRPFYNIVVADKRNRRDGRFIERIGFYNPLARGGEEPLRIALDRLTYWTERGCHPVRHGRASGQAKRRQGRCRGLILLTAR